MNIDGLTFSLQALELAPLPPGFLFTMPHEGVSDDKAVGRLRCQLPEILVPKGKGRFQPIGNEYRGHSADTYYIRIVKRMPLAAGVHKPLMGISHKTRLRILLQKLSWQTASVRIPSVLANGNALAKTLRKRIMAFPSLRPKRYHLLYAPRRTQRMIWLWSANTPKHIRQVIE